MWRKKIKKDVVLKLFYLKFKINLLNLGIKFLKFVGGNVAQDFWSLKIFDIFIYVLNYFEFLF